MSSPDTGSRLIVALDFPTGDEAVRFAERLDPALCRVKIGKELFTSADNYALEISDAVPADSAVRQLILAAVMCIDMVLKE